MESYIVFLFGKDSQHPVESPYFCQTQEKADEVYDELAERWPAVAERLYIAKVIRRPKMEVKVSAS